MSETETSGLTIVSTDPISPPDPAAQKSATVRKTAAAATEKKPKSEMAAAEIGAAAPSPAQAVPVEDGERNGVFSSLVKGDTDVVGLVAYSIYKQNKHDWLVAFRRQRGREPDDVELSAYIIGEATARRLVTYRHLAEATIEGRGPEVSFAPGRDAAARPVARPMSRQERSDGLPAWMFVALAVISLVLILLAARFGVPGITPAG
jgi:hypothetical protein